MCLLPPQCLFCQHYAVDARADESECEAFVEIPDGIFRGRQDHCYPVAGDLGVRFELDPSMETEFDEINELRQEMGLEPFSKGVATTFSAAVDK